MLDGVADQLGIIAGRFPAVSAYCKEFTLFLWQKSLKPRRNSYRIEEKEWMQKGSWMMSKSTEEQRYKLIALDMDGTLLNRQHEVSKENRQAIAEAEERGVQVVLSTGRSIATCADYAKSLELSSYLVTVNGSEIWDPEGKLVERNPLQNETVQTLWDLRNQHDTHYWAVTTDAVFRKDFPDDIGGHEWLKFGFHTDDDEVRKAILEELNKNGQLEISNSSPLNIEVNALGINKANALIKVCKRIGITMKEVLAVGDSLNDLAMIKEAGCGVAMGNAQELVKEEADWVTGTNEEDGVAQAIRRWVL